MRSALVPAMRAASSFPSISRRAISVLFGKWSGTEVKIDGHDLLILKETDIMGVIEGRASATKKRRPNKRPPLPSSRTMELNIMSASAHVMLLL